MARVAVHYVYMMGLLRPRLARDRVVQLPRRTAAYAQHADESVVPWCRVWQAIAALDKDHSGTLSL